MQPKMTCSSITLLRHAVTIVCLLSSALYNGRRYGTLVNCRNNYPIASFVRSTSQAHPTAVLKWASQKRSAWLASTQSCAGDANRGSNAAMAKALRWSPSWGDEYTSSYTVQFSVQALVMQTTSLLVQKPCGANTARPRRPPQPKQVLPWRGVFDCIAPR